MAKKRPQQQPNMSVFPPAHEPPKKDVPDEKSIKPYRRCPLCHGERGGVGVAYRTVGKRRYYRCGLCRHTWCWDFQSQTIEFKH